VNGKLRDKVDVPVGISKENAQAAALASENVQNFLEGKAQKKVIYVPERLVNIVVEIEKKSLRILIRADKARIFSLNHRNKMFRVA